MKPTFPKLGLLVALLVPATAISAMAQPDGKAAGIVTNPPNWDQAGNERNQALATNQTQIQELTQRQSLIYAGITDTKVQDAILLDQKSQDARRQALQEKWFHLQATANNKDSTDTVVRAELNAFEASIEDEKAKRVADVKILDGLIGFSKDARLELHLIAMGVIGDDLMVATGNPGNFARGGGYSGVGVMMNPGGRFLPR